MSSESNGLSKSRCRGVGMSVLACLPAMSVLAVVICAWIGLSPWTDINDDALITLTYVKSLVAGHGFAFNTSRGVLGTTTPLLALVAAACGRIFHSIPIERTAILLTVFCWFLVLWIVQLAHSTLRLERWEACVLGTTLATHFRFYPGGEVTLFQLIMLAAIVLYLRERMLAAGLATGFLYLTRGEGGLLIPAFLCVAVCAKPPSDFRKGRALAGRFLPVVLGFMVVFGAWSLFAEFSFGSIFPHTLKVKMMQGRGSSAGNLFSSALLAELPSWDLDLSHLYPRLFVPLWGFAAYGVFYAWRRRLWFLWVIVVWVSLYIAAYTILQVPAYAGWYRHPVYWAWTYGVGIGLIGAGRSLLEMRRVTRPCRVGFACLLLFTILGLRFFAALDLAIGSRGDPRAPAYHEMCAVITARGDSHATVATGEVGYFGYYLDNPILDLVGIVTPDILPFLARRDYEGIDARYAPKFWVDIRRPYEDASSEKTVGESCFVAGLSRYVPQFGNVYILYERKEFSEQSERLLPK
ncbi:MAG TPA: hypothetical protein P5318_16010 [Candidatus Hydrogenedentes bacterium]|nr:hypothetical protein [Candidatus Hydrogenedentota bacterium]HPC16494.1 hypothetical protein [Candidatus Hydrogenedentota bacterium]HRT21620.1 hypothetical protein [Candidatus Hydrogenedentota bacterium]HRT63239.1 hypothetical protein [Candidatus Hydrogenedentota bacterium]